MGAGERRARHEGALHMGRGALFGGAVRALVCVAVALVLACFPLLLCACDSSDQKTHVTVSVWDGSVITSGFAQYIKDQNPTYDIEWIVGDDSLDFYDYQAEHGSLPDVILAKDFNRVSAEALSDSLYDLSETDIASSYSADFLDSVPGNSDKIAFLPGASGFEGIVMNSFLFEMYGIAVPHDKQSFIDACKAFSQKGIEPLAAGMADPQICYEVMQGFADATLVSKTEDFMGQVLKRNSSSVSVDGSSFSDALSYFGDLMAQGVISSANMSESSDQAEKKFLQGQAAMLFLPDGQASSYGAQHNMTVRALPFFGDESNWAFAQPVFVGMVSDVKSQGVSSTASDEVAHKAAVDVLSSIMSVDAQNYYLHLYGIDKVVSTSGDDAVELPDALSSLSPCLEEGSVRTYLPNKLASDAIGSTFADVASGEVDASGALTEVEGLLKAEQAEDKKVLASFSEGVSNLFDETRGNVAALDIAQASSRVLQTEVFVVSPHAARCPLYAGDKTATDLSYSTAEMPVATVTLTGAQLSEYLSRCVVAAKSPYDLPVVSGLHLEIGQKNGTYQLDSVEKVISTGAQTGGTDTSSANEGRESTAAVHDGDAYTVGISSFDWETELSEADAYGPVFQSGTLQEVWVEAFRSGTVNGLPAYQDYFAFS